MTTKKQKKTKKIPTYTRSARISIKLCNKGKIGKLAKLYRIGKELTSKYIDVLWGKDISKYANSEIYDLLDSNMTDRFKQICATRASDIIRSVTAKIKDKLYVIEQLKKQGDLTNADRLQQIVDNIKVTKPQIKKFALELNGNFVKIILDSSSKHKNWIHLSSLGKSLNMNIPFTKTKTFNKWFNMPQSTMSKFIQLYEDGSIKIVFKVKKQLQKHGRRIGCDIGITNVYALSSGVLSQDDSLGYNCPIINHLICSSEPDSKNCRRHKTHLKNYIEWSINQIDFSNVKSLYIEDIKYIRSGKKTSRYLSNWNYPFIFNKLIRMAEEHGINVIRVNPMNSSRRCYECGWTCKNNRHNKEFKCQKCHNNCDSDINAAKNLTLLNEKRFFKGNSQKGFYISF